METPGDNGHLVRRLTLPSGRQIDVVYYDGATDTADPLHVCGSCGSNLVQPLSSAAVGAEHWRVTLRCPNCAWSGTGVFDRPTVERFDAELDRGADELARALDGLYQARMSAEIDRFVVALEAGHILPDDF